MERRVKEFIGTKEVIEFRGFRLERERGSADLLLCNAQNPVPKIAMPIETFMLMAVQLQNANWWRNATTPTDPQLQ